MEDTKATAFVTLRVTLSQKAQLMNMARRAGDPTPSVTIIRRLFGRKAAITRQKFRLRTRETKRQLKMPFRSVSRAART